MALPIDLIGVDALPNPRLDQCNISCAHLRFGHFNYIYYIAPLLRPGQWVVCLMSGVVLSTASPLNFLFVCPILLLFRFDRAVLIISFGTCTIIPYHTGRTCNVISTFFTYRSSVDLTDLNWLSCCHSNLYESCNRA